MRDLVGVVVLSADISREMKAAACVCVWWIYVVDLCGGPMWWTYVVDHAVTDRTPNTRDRSWPFVLVPAFIKVFPYCLDDFTLGM